MAYKKLKAIIFVCVEMAQSSPLLRTNSLKSQLCHKKEMKHRLIARMFLRQIVKPKETLQAGRGRGKEKRNGVADWTKTNRNILAHFSIWTLAGKQQGRMGTT